MSASLCGLPALAVDVSPCDIIATQSNLDADRSVVWRIDPVSGLREKFYECPPRNNVADVAVGIAGQVYVVRPGNRDVIEVDPRAFDPSNPCGNFTVLASFPSPVRFIDVDSFDQLIVAESVVYRVDPNTKTQTSLGFCTSNVTDMEIDAAGNILLLRDDGLVVAKPPSGGPCSIVSRALSAEALFASGLGIEASGDFVVSDGSVNGEPILYRVDAASDTIISTFADTFTLMENSAHDVEIEADGGILVIGPILRTSVTRIDPLTEVAERVGSVGNIFGIAVWSASPTDSDADGIQDHLDNCIEIANGPLIPDAGGNSQLDSDGDGYGDACDCDFNQDGGCGQPDYSIFLACFGKIAGGVVGPADDVDCHESDMNGDSAIGQPDYSLFITRFGGLPGP